MQRELSVEPGTYAVDPAEQGLRLTPKDGKAEDGKVIQARPVLHLEMLDAPKAVSEAFGENALRVALQGSGAHFQRLAVPSVPCSAAIQKA